MEEQFQHIKVIAYRYFEGKASSQEIETLFAFINENAIQKSIFRSWENEWFASIENNADLENHWNDLITAQKSSKSIRSSIPLKKNVSLHHLFIAASIALLIVGGTIGALKLTRQEPVKYFVLHTPLGQKSSTTLADGTKIWLNSGSTLKYSTAFGKKVREVELAGEAYFEVEKDAKKKFIVKTSDYNVTVKGTKFNVSAYPDDNLSSTSLLEGSVEINHESKSLQMVPGEIIELNKNAGVFTRKRNSSVATATSWKDNKIEYDNIKLEALIKKLARHYNKEIQLSNKALGNSSFSISVQPQESLDDVLKAISKTQPMKIINKNDTIILI